MEIWKLRYTYRFSAMCLMLQCDVLFIFVAGMAYPGHIKEQHIKCKCE